MNMAKSIVAAGVCALATFFTAPSGRAQGTGFPPITLLVVGETSPPGGDRTAQGGLAAQQFSFSSAAYVSRVDLGLTLGPLIGSTTTACTFSLAITNGLLPGGGLGTMLFQRNESINFSAYGEAAFSDSFPAFLLPAGSYYLVLNMEAGASPCDGYYSTVPFAPSLFWLFNSSAATTIGTVGQSFGVFQTPDWIPNPPGQIFVFDLAGPLVILPPAGGGLGQIVRIVEGPVTPPAGGPVEAQIGFVNVETGNLLGPLTAVSIGAGQTESVDLDLTPFITRLGQRVEVQPVIVQSPNAGGASSPVQLAASVQVLDALTGFGTVLAAAPPPGTSAPALGPQIVAGGQTMRVNVVAAGPDACVGQVGFNDKNGSPLIQTVPVSLSSGMSTSVDLNADALGFRLGQRIEAVAVLTVSTPVGAAAVNSACNASVEVFDHLTGRTWSHQGVFAALPAVQ